jgi:hypothetical protein
MRLGVQHALLKLIEGRRATSRPAGGLQARRGDLHPVRHDERPIHLRRGLRRAGGDHRSATGRDAFGFGPPGRIVGTRRRASGPRPARRPGAVRPDPELLGRTSGAHYLDDSRWRISCDPAGAEGLTHRPVSQMLAYHQRGSVHR